MIWLFLIVLVGFLVLMVCNWQDFILLGEWLDLCVVLFFDGLMLEGQFGLIISVLLLLLVWGNFEWM